MDPQQRLLLERGYAALHAAGMRARGSAPAAASSASSSASASGRASLAGARCGLARGAQRVRVDGLLVLGRVRPRLVCARAAGPVRSYDTACSAALAAANHGSVRALQRGECDVGAERGRQHDARSRRTMRGNAVAGMTSVRGRSHTFDARADGYARGEAIDAIACRAAPSARRRRCRAMLVRQRGAAGRAEREPDGAQRAGAAGLLRAALADARCCWRGGRGAARGARHGHGAGRPDRGGRARGVLAGGARARGRALAGWAASRRTRARRAGARG